MSIERKYILTGLLFIAFSVTVVAQNVMYIKNTAGLINDTITVSVAVNNDTAFVSFQCDVLLPAGFGYVQNSILLSSRSADHVITGTLIENNRLRVLSYSLSNAEFVGDSGTVATFQVATPSQDKSYTVALENCILGNVESVNILDSTINGSIVLEPAGITEHGQNNVIRVFPNPVNNILYVKLQDTDLDRIEIKGYSIDGLLLDVVNKTISGNTDTFSVNTDKLFGSGVPDGNYILQFSYWKNGVVYFESKKITLEKTD
jgi:hypothetical protein